MIKEYTATVKAEVFDGSEEMVARYPIRHFPKSNLLSEHWVLDIPTPYDDYPNYPANLLKGQVLVTLPDGTVVNMNPYDFGKLFPEAEK